METLALRVNVTRSDSRFLEQNFASLWQVEEYFAFERSWFEGEVTLKGTMLLQKYGNGLSPTLLLPVDS